MRDNPLHLKHLIIEVAKTLDLLAQHNIVHSDVKTENILIKAKKDNPFCSYKLIDYGSSFSFTNLKQYTLATPEYMCP
jgi:dual specificity tyrosine-phosphorylation-regulated kinase 2/3/4